MKSRLILPAASFWNNFLIHTILFAENSKEEFNNIIFDDVLASPLFFRADVKKSDPSFTKKHMVINAAEILKLNNNNPYFDEIYITISSPSLRVYKQLAKIFTFKKVYFIEESLFSYVRFMVDKKLVKLVNKHQIYLINYDEILLQAIFKAGVNPKNTIFLKKQDLLNNIKNFAEDHNKTAIVLIDRIRFNNPKKDFIINEYKNYLKLLNDNGNSILLRPHPKLDSRIYNDLAEFIKPFPNASINNGKMGVEVLAVKKGSIVIAAYSTALFSLKFLYEADVFTSIKLLKDRVSFFKFNYMALSARVIIYLLPDFSGEKVKLPVSIADYVLGKKYSLRWLLNMFVFWYSRLLLERLHYRIKIK
ncbi:MAG: hypothetical protein FWE18_04510 [Alphaproteobacteria bacterium]|nr:hypothetical protein [Alphaproteobacteria bacterium]